jgi:hypothetical protein
MLVAFERFQRYNIGAVRSFSEAPMGCFSVGWVAQLMVVFGLVIDQILVVKNPMFF